MHTDTTHTRKIISKQEDYGSGAVWYTIDEPIPLPMSAVIRTFRGLEDEFRIGDTVAITITENQGLRVKLVSTECKHEWVDTGIPKTWCKTCNIDGIFNMGTVSIQERNHA